MIAEHYDAEGNVIAVDGGSTARYYYNALNQRVRAEYGSTVREFVYNLAGQRISTWDGATRTQLQSQYYWGDRPVAWADANSLHFRYADWMGTARVQGDANGYNEEIYGNYPWGDGLASSASDANHFAGLDHDIETDTDHATFRQYQPVQGRWMSPGLRAPTLFGMVPGAKRLGVHVPTPPST